MHNASYCKSLRATDGYYQHYTIAGWKDQLNSWAAVLSTPCIHGNSSLICGFNHSFQNLSLFMSLTFILTVNGKHLLQLPDRKELCSPGTSCAPFCYCAPVFLPTHRIGNRVGGVWSARVYIVLMSGTILIKNAATSLGCLKIDWKRKKGYKRKQPICACGSLSSDCSIYLKLSSNADQHEVTSLLTP